MTDIKENAQGLNDSPLAADVLVEVAPSRKERLYHGAIGIKLSPVHGYGVFADGMFLPGETIEECPVVLINEDVAALKNLRFCWKPEGNKVLALGCGSLYNHAEQPNAIYSVDDQHGLLIFTAIKQIYRGEEIFIDYGKAWFAKRNLDPTSFQPLKKEKAAKVGQHSRGRLVRVTALSLLLVAAYALTPKVVKLHFPTLQDLTTALQKRSLVH